MSILPSPKDLPADLRGAAVETVAAETALRQAVSRPLASIGEIPVYRAEPLEALALRDYPHVVTVENDDQLRVLLAGPKGPVILVPKALNHTLASLSHLVPQGAAGKALLLEQSA